MSPTAATGDAGTLRSRQFSVLIPVLVYAASRLFDWALLAWLKQQEARNPVAMQMQDEFGDRSATWGTLLTSWDGEWYVEIATVGYPDDLVVTNGVMERNAWAFYPVYPALVRLLMVVGLPVEVAAVGLSAACGLAAAIVFHHLILANTDFFTAAVSVTALCFSPPALVLQIAYTESLALLLVLGCIWTLSRRRYDQTLILAAVLSLTRPLAVPLAATMCAIWLARWIRRRRDPFSLRERMTLAVVAMVTGLLFFVWPWVTSVATGVPGAYAWTQRDWHNPGESWVTWVTAALSGSVDAIVVLTTFCALYGFVVLRPASRRWGVELRTWAIVYPLYILTVSRTTTSIVRYMFLAAAPAWPFPDVTARITSTRARFALLLGVAAAGATSQYWWAQWFFVQGPHTIGFP